MNDPIRVLVIEDLMSDRFMAQRLFGTYDLDFTWQHAASAPELRVVAQEFNPNLIFSANALTVRSRSAAIEMLRLLTLRTAVIHVVEVDDCGGPALAAASLEWKPSSLTATSYPTQALAILAGGSVAPRATHWRKTLPSLIESSTELAAMSDSSGWITYVNTKTARALSEAIGQPLGTVLGSQYEFAAAGRDTHRIAYFDAVTGMPNPAHLSDLLSAAMAQARGSRIAFPIVALDLPGLGLMSELGGRAMSDEVLKVVSSALKFGDAGSGMIARVGEDDLLMVLSGPSSPADAVIKLHANRGSAAASTESCAESAPAGSAPAESAMWAPVDWAAAGSAAAPAMCSIDAALPESPRPPLEAGLDDALKRHAIRVHFQPQFELQSGRGCGVEALARWILASGENVAPAIFIPAAEKAGMIGTLGASVLQIACDTAAAWRGQEAEHLTVSVNVSTLQMNQKFLKILRGALETSGLRASRLELEIAESAVLASAEATALCLREWKQLGVRVAVNHAGTNYSSLKYLSHLPIDRLKLDKSLIKRLSADEGAVRVVHALIALGAQMGIEVIAEGVETEQQLESLRELGCLQAQGFLFGRPMPAVQAQVALRKPWGNLPRSARPGLPKSNPAGVDVHEIGTRVEAHTAAR